MDVMTWAHQKEKGPQRPSCVTPQARCLPLGSGCRGSGLRAWLWARQFVCPAGRSQDPSCISEGGQAQCPKAKGGRPSPVTSTSRGGKAVITGCFLQFFLPFGSLLLRSGNRLLPCEVDWGPLQLHFLGQRRNLRGGPAPSCDPGPCPSCGSGHSFLFVFPGSLASPVKGRSWA